MGKWYVVRHGITEWNANGRNQGQSDTSLSAQGIRQAMSLGRRLADTPLHAAYVSDLSRARETAQGILAERDTPVTPMSELREASYGAWEGLTFRQIEEEYPKEFHQLMNRTLDFAPPDGESAAQVMERVREARDRIAAAHSLDEDILVVGHSGSVSPLVVILLGLPVETVFRFRALPCSLSIVTVHENGATLDLWNDTSHVEMWHGS